jgi:hypothetical protein
MANAATLLYDLLTRWRVPPNTSMQKHRQEVLDESDHVQVGFWRMQTTAAGYLTQVEDALDWMEQRDEDVVHVRELMPVYYQAVFEPNTQWHAGTSEVRGAQPLELLPLKSLGRQLELLGYSNMVTGLDVSSIRELLTELSAMVLDATDIPPEARAHLMALIRRCDQVLDDLSIYGDVQVRTLLAEIGANTMAVAAEAQVAGDTSLAKRLFGLGFRFVAKVGKQYGLQQGVLFLDAGAESLTQDALEAYKQAVLPPSEGDGA